MKILTLNLHCFAEDDILENQIIIANQIIEENIDIIFLQEVAQSEKEPILFDDIKKDNYAYQVQLLLENLGLKYDLHYKIGNRSFNFYDEGLAILSKASMFDKSHFFVSKNTDYHNWKTRVIVNAKIKYKKQELVLTSAHLGWTDGFETFEDQVDRLINKLNKDEFNIIGGDFNVKAGSEEYDYLVNKGYLDLYYNNDSKYFNVPTRKENADIKIGEHRIDFILSNKKVIVKSRKILFEDIMVSDHYGVLIDLELL